jgi:hypothetical protein
MICYRSLLFGDGIFNYLKTSKKNIMKTFIKHGNLLIAILLFTGYASVAQNATETANSKTKNETVLKTYVIERNIPGAGKFTAEKLKDISQTSCSVLKEMGPKIQWIQSYVVDDKIFCVYKAENEDLLREHAKRGGFPVTAIYEVANIISPATAK